MANGKLSRGLGRGLDSLFQVEQIEASENKGFISDALIKDLRPNPYQPRKAFDEVALDELKRSIIENGIIQPLIVRKSTVKGFEIIAGERRFRAARLAGLHSVPVVVQEFNDSQMMEIALLENLQREDLSPIEEAEAYYNIMEKLEYTQEMIADRMGKSRSHVANYLRLLSLPKELKAFVSKGDLSFGHAKVLLGVKDLDVMKAIAKQVVDEQLSVRELEKLVIKPSLQEKKGKKLVQELSSREQHFVNEQTEFLRERFGTKVAINVSDKGKGSIEINFLSLEDLERVLKILE